LAAPASGLPFLPTALASQSEAWASPEAAASSVEISTTISLDMEKLQKKKVRTGEIPAER
jgi:hypothetical protein